MVEPSLMVFFFIITEKNKSRVSFCPLSLMAMERGFKSYQDLLEMSKSYSFVYHQPSCKGEHARYNVYVYLITPTCTQLTINLQGKGVQKTIQVCCCDIVKFLFTWASCGKFQVLNYPAVIFVYLPKRYSWLSFLSMQALIINSVLNSLKEFMVTGYDFYLVKTQI